jgi:hypothetical protein
LESVLGCEGKIISEVLVSGFEGEKKTSGFCVAWVVEERRKTV